MVARGHGGFGGGRGPEKVYKGVHISLSSFMYIYIIHINICVCVCV